MKLYIHYIYILQLYVMFYRFHRHPGMYDKGQRYKLVNLHKTVYGMVYAMRRTTIYFDAVNLSKHSNFSTKITTIPTMLIMRAPKLNQSLNMLKIAQFVYMSSVIDLQQKELLEVCDIKLTLYRYLPLPGSSLHLPRIYISYFNAAL